ncbi:MAG: hypothetical protein L6R36_008207 [Xanthoria steineri]|nr:MAG: hypothetical protein L6R36_008207 [Xanthoria steineri]
MDGVSIAASLLGLGTVGCQIAIKLHTLAFQISTASQRISSVSNNISLTAGVLKELGEFMTRETAKGGESIFSQSNLETTKNSATICESIFNQIEQAAKEASDQLRTRNRIIGKIKLSKSEKAKWPFLQPSIESLRTDLREAKGTLMLMLQLTNLAVSQRMATITEEQREIYRVILALQKQSQGDSSSRAKRLSLDGSGEGPPPPLASHTNSRKTSLRGQGMTSASLSMAGQNPPAFARYQALMAMPDPLALPESALESSNKTPSLGSANATDKDAIDKVRRNSMKSNSTRSALDGNKTSQPDATLDTQREQRRDLSHFVIKPYILDDHSSPGAISLKFRLDSIPVRQVQIQKGLLRSEEYGHQSVLDAYLDLCDHERVLITGLIDGADSHITLKHLKRSFNEISHRGIMFKGVPALRFIMERLTNENQNKSDDEERSEAAREIAREAAREAARKAARKAEMEAECRAAREAGSTHSTPTILRSDSAPTILRSDSTPTTPTTLRCTTYQGPPLRDMSSRTSADRSLGRYSPPLVDVWMRPLSSSMYHNPEERTNLKPHLADFKEDKQSDDSDKSSIMSDDDAMNDEEAEKAVKELLEKYTTLGTVGPGIG